MADEWWRGAVFYQIYPRSFKDTTGSGVGDLQGVTEKLDYVASLGVDAIWLSPFFKSPMKDYGYDVSDYRNVDPLFGTLDDFKKLLDKAHKLGLRLIVDMVLNHTSDQHPWFLESRQDKDNAKADWYVWVDPKKDGTPPNNWLSVFGGSAWRYDPMRGQSYLHSFLKEQPDLNYYNPLVMNAVLEECRFWLDMGVDGFRLDAINFCFYDLKLRNNPPRKTGFATQLEFKDAYSMQKHKYDKSRPENMLLVKEIRALLDEYPDRMALAEIGDDNATKLAAAYTAGPEVFHTAYSFALMANKGPMPGADLFRNVIEEQLAEPGDSWPSWAFSNHDVIRAASRWSGSEYGYDPRLSKLLIALLCALRGTPFIYQGDELGLPEADIPYKRICDPWGKYLYPKWKGRDGCRTPMPWSDESAQAGFTQGAETWLPVPEEHLPLSVKAQESDEASTLQFTRNFLAWRKSRSCLRLGDISFTNKNRNDLLSFNRIFQGKILECYFNLTPKCLEYNEYTLPPYGALFVENGEIVYALGEKEA